ncbi:MAG: tRNA uridine-5-carboxymethylaminomethyl(34) synthesis GTPase MnmE [Candidatus Fimenecus sp.]
MEETIVAIASAYGEAGIGIVRISGERALEIFEKIFRTKGNIVDRQFNYGHIVDPLTGQVLDEVMAVYLKAPRTYTREDVVEIDCHGGIVPLKNILQLVVKMGAKIADRGEFTKRAFLNGRLDLSEAEAVIDLIKSKSEKSFELAQNQANGYLSKKIRAYRQSIMEILVDIAVNIDYPDDDIEEIAYDKLLKNLKNIMSEIVKLLESARTGKILREGLDVAIVGKPNVGKSSLLNLLSKQEKAIVTNIAGTTRDTIEANISISGIPINLIDTAGMRTTEDEIEKIGILRSKEALEKAELVILMLDASKPLETEDYDIIESLKYKETIVFFNKTDLGFSSTEDKIFKIFQKTRIIYGTVRNEKGIKHLEEQIEEVVFGGKIKVDNNDFISSVRHKDLLEKTRNALADAILATESKQALDFVEVDIKNAYDYLGEIIGENVSDDVINTVFSKFCLGK